MFKKYIVTFFFITYLPFVYGFDGTRKFLGYTLGTIIPKTTVKFVGDLKKRVQGNPYNQSESLIFLDQEKLPSAEIIEKEFQKMLTQLKSLDPNKIPYGIEQDDTLRITRHKNVIKFQKTPEYLLLAQEQLGQDWKWRLVNMHKERFPLTFVSYHQFKTFINEFKSLLRKNGFDAGFFKIKGSSTTFMSHNPNKGLVINELIKAPQDFQRLKNSLYYFDKNKYYFDPSDIDIHLKIPQLSDLCANRNAMGNDGERPVYYEHETLRMAPFIIDFKYKWEKILGREVNFNIYIDSHPGNGEKLLPYTFDL